MTAVMHLRECEPERHPEWAASTHFEGVNHRGAEMCPDTRYMAEEMYPDEEVWIEAREGTPASSS